MGRALRIAGRFPVKDRIGQPNTVQRVDVCQAGPRARCGASVGVDIGRAMYYSLTVLYR